MCWRRASTWREEPGERLTRRFDFVETAARYLVATLAVEHEARGLAAAQEWDTLKGALGAQPVSLGLWCSAARDLSRSVLRQRDPILGPLAEVLAEREGALGPGWRGMERLVSLRNTMAHRDGGVDLGALLRETDDPFRDLLTALRHVGRLSPWVATSLDVRGGVFEVTALPLRGTETLPPRVVQAAKPIEKGRPFVVTADGTLVYLSPFLRWGAFQGATAREPELRLLKEWRKGPRYSDPLGLEGAAIAGGDAGRPDEWLARGVAGAIVPAAFLPHTNSASVLHEPDRGDRPPEIPGYRVGARIGQGGNGRVYLARSQPTAEQPSGEQVAVKVLPAELVADEGGRGRLLREFELMRSLTHPNVTRVFEFLPESPAGPVLVMEYVPGVNLRALVADRAMGATEASGVLSQLLAGLAAAHARGIVHRDITPENVVIGPGGEVKLLDFGIAVAPGSERLTRTIDGLGKVSFAAPEQIHRPREAGPPADVYACGKLLGFLVSGSADLQVGMEALPGALQQIVRRATEEVPERRFADAARMREAVEAARRQGWAGSPLGPGDRLSPEFEVASVARQAGPGLWFVWARREGELRIAVVAERRREAEAALDAELRALRPEARERLGHPDVRETRDGLRWCLLRVRSIAEIGGPFGTPPVAERTVIAPSEIAPPPWQRVGEATAGGPRAPSQPAAATPVVVQETPSPSEPPRGVKERTVIAPPPVERERTVISPVSSPPPPPSGMRTLTPGLAAPASPAPAAPAAPASPAPASSNGSAPPASGRTPLGAAAVGVARVFAGEDPPRSPPPPPLATEGRPTWQIEPPSPAEFTSSGLGWALLVFAAPVFLPFLLAPLIPLFRLGAWRKLPPVPTSPRPSYLPPLPERWLPEAPAEAVRALDLRARAVIAQRHMAGIDVLPPAQLRVVLTEPLLATWSVLRLPPASLGPPYRAQLPTASARASAMRCVRRLHGHLVAGRGDVPAPFRLRHALLLLDRLAHAGAAAVPADRVEAVLRG